MRPTDRPISQSDIAARLGLGQKTVSRVFGGGPVSVATRTRVLRAAHGGELLTGLAELLERFRDPKQLGDNATIIRDVNAMRAAIEAASK